MDGQTIGKALILFGVVLVLAGLFFYVGGNRILPLGRLPGDIRIEGEHTKFYFPIATSILVSIVLTLVFFVLSRWR